MKGSREECRWVSVSGTPRFDEDGNFLGYRGVGHNVTGLAASFEELQRLHGQLAGTAERDRMLNDERAGESHVERMMEALDVMSDAFCYYDADDRIVLYNEALISMYSGLGDVIRPGLSFEEFIDAGLERGFWDLEGHRPEDWRAALLAGRKATASSRSMVRLADGRGYVHREVRTADGGTIATCTDITELENRQAALARASEESGRLLSDLERTLDSMKMGVVLLDADLNARIINRAFYDIWNLEPGEVAVGSPFRALMDVNRYNGVYDIEADQWEEYVSARLAELRDGAVAPREFSRADGCTMVYSVTALSGGKRLVCYYDITEMKDREAELAAALERSHLAQSVINSVKDPIFVKDDNLRFVLVNDAFAAMFDKRPEDMLGKPGSDFLPAEEVTEFERDERQVLKTGERLEVEEDFEFQGIGRSRVVQRNRVRMKSGRSYIACVVFDVSELKRRETEAEEARKRLADVLDALPAGVVMYDSDDRFLMANKIIHEALPGLKPAWKRESSFRDAIVLGHSIGYFRESGEPEVDALYDTDEEAWVEGMLAHYRRPSSVFERRNPDGRWYKVFDMRTADGTFIGVRVDITEQKERERELRRSMRKIELYRHVLDELPVATYVKSDDLAFEFINKAWSYMTGVSKDDAIGHTDRDFFGEEGEGFAGRDEEVIRSGETIETEETLTHRDGTQRQLIARKSRLIASDGTVHLIGSSIDISELKSHERSLQEARQRAVLADRAKSEFLANMSHEIRTPMNGVLGMAELLAKSDLDPKQKTFTEIIVKSGNALLTIINDILDFSKIDAGQLVLDPAPFNLAEAIEDVATLVSTRAKEKDIELVVRIAPELGEAYVGDAGRIRQIITNLIGNAIKFTDAGYVLVDVGGEAEGAETRIRISVTDTGIGIPAEKLGVIFEKFSQVDSSSTRRHEGTGLGLAITSRLVALMGGEIGAESTEGAGSTFWFEVSLPNARQTARKITPSDVTGARVLIVDDNKVNRAILAEQMAAWSFDACAASSGEEGLRVLEAAQARGVSVDCIVLDYQMPEMNGAEMARIVRQTAAIADTPIVMLTSVDQSLSGPLYRNVAINAQLTKPARSSVLLETLVSTIQANRGRLPETAEAEGAEAEPMTALVAARQEKRASTGTGDHSIDILVAEDNEVNQLVFTQILGETGYSFEIVGNGKLALAAYGEMKPRMILMDVSMPEMNGLEATGAIRRAEAESGGHVPIIGVTAHALKGDRERCLEAGMDDYLPKPISPKALVAKIERWALQGGEAARETG
ncbi:PAS-domain containing protein [Mesorhizobium sp. 10J20-29]